MTSSNFLIGPINDGIRLDIKPFAIPEDAFTILVNMYQWRGRLVRRAGYTKLGRLANGTPVMGLRTMEGFAIDVQTLVAFDTLQAFKWNGTAFILLPSVMPVIWNGTDHDFFFTTNYADAFWATNNVPGLNGVNVSNAVAGAGFTTITTTAPHGFTTGQTVVLINLGGTTDLDGNTYVITVTGPNTFTVPFQTAFIYTGNGIALNSQVTSAGQDGIRYYGILQNGTGWANYSPPIDPNTALAGALMIFPYRGYLVFLSTWEGNDLGVQNYGNRARWTQIGTPYYSPPVPSSPNLQGIDPKTARDDLFGRGGANDAPTNEVIVGAAFIRDILIVYFERSTWRLRFVNNAQNPFVWERVNVELGAEGTFSVVPFDKGLMAIGNRGIVISDGNDTIRIDEKIPDEFFNIRQANYGFDRIQGIRTFRSKLVYWTIPSAENETGTYPDYVLVYNYDTKTWSKFDDQFTTFGYFYPLNGEIITWADLPQAWSSYSNISWNSGTAQSEVEKIVAGNMQGYVFVLKDNGSVNDPSLAISAITAASPGVFTSANNNLPDGVWVSLTGVTGTTSDDGVSLNGRNFQFNNPTLDANNFSLSEYAPSTGTTADGATYSSQVSYKYLLPGSAQINIGTLVFTDAAGTGVLTEASSLGSGTIDYSTGIIDLVFTPAIVGPLPVIIRIVSLDPLQNLLPVNTIGAYGGGGEVIRISGIDIQTKFFNFFKSDKRSRLSKIDFYLNSTSIGQVTANIFMDSSNEIGNTPLPDNLQSNVVLTSINPYQYGEGEQTIFRLYTDVIAQTVQLELTLSNAQLAVNCISQSDFELIAMMWTLRQGGRLV